MAEKKISELSSLTGAQSDGADLLPIVDVSATETKKITRDEFFTNIPSLGVTGNTVIGGNLTVNGTTTTVNSQTLDVADKNVTLAFGAIDGAAADGGGITLAGANATFSYSFASDTWVSNKAITSNLTGNVTGTVSSLSNHTTDALVEGSNLYYTDTRANSAIDARVTQTFVNNLNVNAATLGGKVPADFVAQTSVTGAAVIPTGTEAQRPTPATGQLRFNTDAASFEGYDGTAWGAIGGAGGGATGGGTDQVFYENDQIVTTNYTIPANKNAMTTGPIDINAGVTVTVSTGARWVII